MKNKFLKGAHLSEKEVRELIRHFCDGISASEIATLTKISRITVNAYFKLFRSRILDHLIQNSVNQDLYKNPDLLLTNVYGISIIDENVVVEPISISQDIIDAMKRLRKIDVSNFLLDQNVKHYNAIIDFKSIKMFKLQNTLQEIEMLERFWNDMKTRLVKSRGINRKTLLLHVKEIELRQRFDQKDLFFFLHQLFLNKHSVENFNITYPAKQIESLAI